MVWDTCSLRTRGTNVVQCSTPMRSLMASSAQGPVPSICISATLCVCVWGVFHVPMDSGDCVTSETSCVRWCSCSAQHLRTARAMHPYGGGGNFMCEGQESTALLHAYVCATSAGFVHPYPGGVRMFPSGTYVQAGGTYVPPRGTYVPPPPFTQGVRVYPSPPPGGGTYVAPCYMRTARGYVRTYPQGYVGPPCVHTCTQGVRRYLYVCVCGGGLLLRRLSATPSYGGSILSA